MKNAGPAVTSGVAGEIVADERPVGQALVSGDGFLARDEWRQNWCVVLAVTLGVALSTVPIYSIGVMVVPLEQAFGWSRTEITAGKMITSLVSICMGPFIGLAVDRLGARRLAVTSSILLCAAMALLATTGNDIWSWWLRWALIAVVSLGVTMTIWIAAISSLFSASRGLALAIALSGAGLGSAITPVFAQYLVDTQGWREAYLGLALFWALVAVPPILMWFTSHKDRMRRGGPAPKGGSPVLSGLTFRQALRSPRYYMLAGAACLASTIIIGLSVNFVPLLVEGGMKASRAAALAGVVGVSSIVGRLISGFLLDRINGNLIAAVSVALPILTCVILPLVAGSTVLALVAALALGLALGAELDAVAYLCSRHLGMRNFGLLFGPISGLLAFGAGFGPILASYVYDTSGSYHPSLVVFAGGSVIAATFFLLLGPYPNFENEA